MWGEIVGEFRKGWATGWQEATKHFDIFPDFGSSSHELIFIGKVIKILNNIGARNYLKIFFAYSNAPVPWLTAMKSSASTASWSRSSNWSAQSSSQAGRRTTKPRSIGSRTRDTQSSAGDKFLKFVSGYCSRASIERNIDTSGETGRRGLRISYSRCSQFTGWSGKERFYGIFADVIINSYSKRLNYTTNDIRMH